MSTGVITNFHRKLADLGLISGGPQYVTEFASLAAERDMAEQSLRATGRFDSGDGWTVNHPKDDADIPRVIREAQQTAEVARQFRGDASVPQASQALTSFNNLIYRIRHPELRAFAGQYLPIATDVDRAAEEYVWYEEDLFGVARAGSTYSIDDIPLVGGGTGHANRGGIMPFLCGFETNFMDRRREDLARRNGKPNFQTEDRKLKACFRVIAEAINALFLWGDGEIPGLHTHSGVQVTGVPFGNWAGASGLEIKNDVVFMLDRIAQQSINDLGDNSKLRLSLPRRLLTIMRNTPVTTAGTGESRSVYSYVKDSYSLRDDQITALEELAAANSQAYQGGPQNLDRDRAMAVYLDAGDDEGLDGSPAFVLPQAIELPTAPVLTGMGRTQYVHARAGGLRLPDARRIQMFEGM